MLTIIRYAIGIVKIALSLLELIFLVRAIMSWIMPYENNSFARFVRSVTDTVTAPVRRVLNRFDGIRTFPLDLSFLITFLLITAVHSLLPTVVL